MARVAMVAGFGALGALLRLWTTDLFARTPLLEFPWATFTVNMVGSFLLGVIYAMAPDDLSHLWRVGLGIGLMGALTTFSTFMWEAMRLVDGGAPARAGVYVAASIGCGFALVVAGNALGKTI